MQVNAKAWRKKRRARREAQAGLAGAADAAAVAMGRPGVDALRHARLFEMIRQQDLATRALQRLHLRVHHEAPVPSPQGLAESLRDQPSR